MYTVTGEPLSGTALQKLQLFLRSCGLDYDPSIQFTVVLIDDDEIAATGSLDGSTIKCVAVSPDHQGEDLTAQVLTALMTRAAQDGISHLMLYTKPHNQHLFAPLGFHPVIRTTDVLLMENRRNGLANFLNGLSRPSNAETPVGCIVANCNPFTLGHRYLIEKAASECAWLHVFVLSEEGGMFSAQQRFAMVQAGCSDLKNVLIHPTGPYMVSSATFPTYFIKEKARTQDIHCEMDIRLFGEKIAPALGITRRYVGTEPGCAVTAHYNETMKRLLPGYQVELMELARKTGSRGFISASKAREMLVQGRTDELADLLPASTIALIHS